MSATIHYHDIGDYLSREEKLRIIDDFGDISRIPWQAITPDRHGDWLNKRDSEFDDYVPLAPEKKFDAHAKAFFTFGTVGTKTNRDVWAINFSQKAVRQNMEACIAFYNECANNGVATESPKHISWTRANRHRCEKKELSAFYADRLFPASYRPFSKQYLYCDREWNEVIGVAPYIFPTQNHQNKVICVSGLGGTKDFSCIMTDVIPDYELIGKSQCFPLYWYEERKRNDNVQYMPGLEPESGYIRHDAISDFILTEFRRIAGPKVQKEDVFYWVYGALHDPGYRARFAADLKKQLPRLPLPKDRKAFEKVLEIGRKLALLHLHYEEIDPWPLDEIAASGKAGERLRVSKMAWAKDGKAVRKDMLVVNPFLTLAGVPKEAHEYVVNGRTPLEWLIERYQVKTDAESGIVNDPNKWGEEHGYPEYIVELVKRIVRLSVETVELIRALPRPAQDGSPALPRPDQDGLPCAALRPVPETAVSGKTPPYWWKSMKPGVASPMPEGGNVVIGLAHKWYDKIEAGFKHDEFRQKTPYWDERLGGRKGKELRSVTFMRGKASSEQMTWEALSVATATRPGYAGYYVIHLGKRIR